MLNQKKTDIDRLESYMNFLRGSHGERLTAGEVVRMFDKLRLDMQELEMRRACRNEHCEEHRQI